MPGTQEVLRKMLVPSYHLVQSGAMGYNPNNYLLNYIEFLNSKGLNLRSGMAEERRGVHQQMCSWYYVLRSGDSGYWIHSVSNCDPLVASQCKYQQNMHISQ